MGNVSLSKRFVVEIFLETPHPCPYIPSETCQNLTFDAPPLPVKITSQLLEAGFRHFGTRWFTPSCPSCTRCQGVKIDLQNFRPSKSQRRLLNKNKDLTLYWGEVTITPEKLDLINRYHADQEEKVGWFEQIHNEENYRDAFITGATWSEEYTIYDGEILVGVGIIDLTNERASSIYFYYDPEYRDHSLGTWSILQEIMFCKEQGREWLHLGLWNETCPSLSYKNRFSPNEFLKSNDQSGIMDELERIFS